MPVGEEDIREMKYLHEDVIKDDDGRETGGKEVGQKNMKLLGTVDRSNIALLAVAESLCACFVRLRA